MGNTDGMLTVFHGAHMSLQDEIDVSFTAAIMLSRQIIQEEINRVRRKHPDVNFERINSMLISGDAEMHALGKELLKQNCPLVRNIIDAIVDNDHHTLCNHIQMYVENNKMSIL